MLVVLSKLVETTLLSYYMMITFIESKPPSITALYKYHSTKPQNQLDDLRRQVIPMHPHGVV